MTTRETTRTTLTLAGLSAALLTVVAAASIATASPDRAPFISGALLGISFASVGFGLAGWGFARRRTDGGRPCDGERPF
ncbi:hypothetical protein [Streptomyces sp. NPDC059009]|uniref:hypothetical protein n=1 Tax=Streptomyces sp. NPDC059009 TaxID=3346694 RepID=UPI0036C44ED7